MSAAKIPAIRDRMRQQEILTRELGGPAVEVTARSAVVAEGRRAQRQAGDRYTASRQPSYQKNLAPVRPSRPAMPGFASLIRKVIAS